MNAGKLPGVVEKRSVLRYLGDGGPEAARVISRQTECGQSPVDLPSDNGCGQASCGHGGGSKAAAERIVLAGDSWSVRYVCQAGSLIDRVLGLLAAEGVSEPAVAATVLIPETWGEDVYRLQKQTDGDAVIPEKWEKIPETWGEDVYRLRRQADGDAVIPEKWEKNDTRKEAENGLGSNDLLPGEIPGSVQGMVSILADAFAARGLGREAAANIKSGVGAKDGSAWLTLSASGLGDGMAGRSWDCRANIHSTPETYSIVMAGYAALEATAIMIAARQEFLCTRLSGQYLEEGMRLSGQTDVRRAVSIARQAGAWIKLPGEGGIFAALWEIADFLGCGLKADIRKILLRQETIEVCELLDLNPYMAFSGGCVLAVTDRPDDLAAAYRAEGIRAAVLGHLMSGGDRIIQNGEEHRFLEPFRQDELYRTGILGGG